MSTNRVGLTSLRSVASQIQRRVFGPPTNRQQEAAPAEFSKGNRETSLTQQKAKRPDWYQATHRSDV